MNIRIFYDDTSFRYRGWKSTRKIIERILIRERKTPGSINFIITSDEKLIGINRQFLEHDYYTDVITFNYNDGDTINGEIYISADTVKGNAKIYNTKLNNEMKRVMIHGILHLTGYDDNSDSEKAMMRKIEDMWLMEAEE